MRVAAEGETVGLRKDRRFWKRRMGSGAMDGEQQKMKVSPDGVRMPEDTASGA